MEVLENNFLTPFHDEIDGAKLYILSGQLIHDSIKENLLSLDETILKQLMSEYIEGMSTETYSGNRNIFWKYNAAQD